VTAAVDVPQIATAIEQWRTNMTME